MPSQLRPGVLSGFLQGGNARLVNLRIVNWFPDAGREMASQIATDVLIIEDEPLIAMDLEQVVKRLGHRVVGVARTRADALKCAGAADPGLILADIQLAAAASLRLAANL
jgi:PleD family two-component response regulator